MSSAEKLLARMRASQADWGRDDLKRLYLGFGFVLREGGNHMYFKHPKYPWILATVARHDPLGKGYVRDALKNIDKLKQMEGAI